jgi:hypothetical protein
MDIGEESFIRSAAAHILTGLVQQNKTVSKQDVAAAADMAFQLNDELNKRLKKLK